MSEYGVTEKGFVLKRFDTILAEVQDEVSDALGFDVSQNPQSLLNSALLVPFCDKIAALWETLQDSYYAKYPATAEGVNLDNACQYGNIFRKGNKSTEYIIHVKATDGTIVPKGSVISSITNPVVQLKCASDTSIERLACNNICIKPVITSAGVYTVELNAKLYSYTAGGTPTIRSILNGLKRAIVVDGYSVELNEDETLLTITDSNLSRQNEYQLTSNLTTEWVENTVPYYTVEYGDIECPIGSITVITSNVTGLISVENRLEPTAGRVQQSDAAFRQDYIKKTYSTSSSQTYSIESYLLENVQNIASVRCYENQYNVEDEYGRPPHSIEVIVDGGDEQKIAEAILMKKSGGITTFGDITINVLGEYGDVIPISFRRPESVYAWIKVEITNGSIAIDPDYERLVQETIVEAASVLSIGDAFISQKYINALYDVLPTMEFCKITLAGTTEDERPEELSEGNIQASQRQKIIVEAARIEVLLNE